MVSDYRGWGSGFIFQYIMLKYNFILLLRRRREYVYIWINSDCLLWVLTYDHNILSVICNALMSRDTHLMFTKFHYFMTMSIVQSLIPIVSTICFYLLEGHVVKVYLINNHVLTLTIRNCTHVYYRVVSWPSMSVIYRNRRHSNNIISDKIAWQ